MIKERFYKKEYVKNNNEIIRDFCEKNKIDFIEIYENFIDKDYKSLLDDGVHPTTEGHQQMYEIIKDFLVKNKII